MHAKYDKLNIKLLVQINRIKTLTSSLADKFKHLIVKKNTYHKIAHRTSACAPREKNQRGRNAK